MPCIDVLMLYYLSVPYLFIFLWTLRYLVGKGTGGDAFPLAKPSRVGSRSDPTGKEPIPNSVIRQWTGTIPSRLSKNLRWQHYDFNCALAFLPGSVQV